MDQSVKTFLESFDLLPDISKRESAAEILKRTAGLELSVLDENSLLENAENIFLELDKEEFGNA